MKLIASNKISFIIHSFYNLFLMLSKRSKKLIDYLTEELEVHLPHSFKTFPYELLQLIVLYSYEGFKILQCPASGRLLSNPVVIKHSKIAPIVYDYQTVQTALAHELKKFNLQENDIKPVPMISELVSHVSCLLYQNYQEPESRGDYKTDEINLHHEVKISIADDDEEEIVENNEAKFLIECPLFKFLQEYPNASSNNLAKDIKEMVSFKKLKHQQQLGKLLTNFIWPVMERSESEYELRKFFCLRGFFYAGNMILQMAVTPGFNFQAIDGKEKIRYFAITLSLMTMFNRGYILQGCSDYGKSKFFGMLFYLLDLLRYSIVLAPVNFWVGFGSGINPYEAEISSSALTFLLSSKEKNLLKPLAKRSNLSCLLAINSFINLGFYYYYLEKNTVDQPEIYHKLVAWACFANCLTALPRILVASRQTAHEIKEVVRDSSFIERNFEGFLPEANERVGRHGNTSSRLILAIVCGCFAFVISDNPLFAVIAALAALNESSLGNVLNGANNRYRLFSSERRSAWVDEIPEEKALFQPRSS